MTLIFYDEDRVKKKMNHFYMYVPVEMSHKPTIDIAKGMTNIQVWFTRKKKI